MAVLVEGISVVVRRDSIGRRFVGGWPAFVSCVPNSTLCTDGKLARVGFLDPTAVEEFIHKLEHSGLTFLDADRCVDIVVVDQQHGTTKRCEWVEFARITFDTSGGKVGACWLFEAPRLGFGVHLPAEKFDFATPADWTFKGSLSDKFTFIPNKSSR
jgi:hypothetical protein